VIELSVLIATYNRAERLLAMLQSLCMQTLAAECFEVIIIVDGSTDETCTLLSGLDTPFRMRWHWQENAGQPSALNKAIALAEGSCCLLLDDDITADPELLAEHLAAHRRDPTTIGIGQITLDVGRPTDWFVREYATSWTAHYAELNGSRRSPDWTDCFGGNLSARRDALRQVGGFATDLQRGLDVELAYRLVAAGLRPEYLQRAVGHQDERKGVAELTRDMEKRGASMFAAHLRHPGMLAKAIASYHHTRFRSVLLQRVALFLGLPPRWIARLVGLLGKTDRKAFHFVSNYAYWKGVRRAVPDRQTWRRLTGGTIILMYHAFARDDEAATTYVIPPARFRRQVMWLRRLGWTLISMDEYIACRREHRFPPHRSVVITIDDGYEDVFGVAAFLAREAVPAMLFLVTARMGQANDWSGEGPLVGRRLLRWDAACQLAAAGVGLGAHTQTHSRLPSLPVDRALSEISESKRELEENTGQHARVFAAPYGETNPTIQQLVRSAGFEAACGIDPGANTVHTPLEGLKRVEVFGTDRLPVFLLKTWLGQSHLPRMPRLPRPSFRPAGPVAPAGP
jgi:glycosyltransferase involved in cell wall biosynthesis